MKTESSLAGKDQYNLESGKAKEAENNLQLQLTEMQTASSKLEEEKLTEIAVLKTSLDTMKKQATENEISNKEETDAFKGKIDELTKEIDVLKTSLHTMKKQATENEASNKEETEAFEGKIAELTKKLNQTESSLTESKNQYHLESEKAKEVENNLQLQLTEMQTASSKLEEEKLAEIETYKAKIAELVDNIRHYKKTGRNQKGSQNFNKSQKRNWNTNLLRYWK